jgi:hypothetical protein
MRGPKRFFPQERPAADCMNKVRSQRRMTMSKAHEIFREAFDNPRDPRSDEYKNGVIAVLRFRLGESTEVRCGYRIGSAQADAYFAGCDEGHRLAREHLEKVGAGETATEWPKAELTGERSGVGLTDGLCVGGIMRFLTNAEVKEKIFWYFRRNFKTQSEAAEKYQCSTAFISAVATGRKPPTERMLADIGIKKVSGYVDA